jgi:hypothetical protein
MNARLGGCIRKDLTVKSEKKTDDHIGLSVELRH